MTINGKIGEFSRDEERARGGGHDPVVLAKAFVAEQGELPVGLVVTEKAAGCVPLVVVDNEAVGTGNGSLTTFTTVLDDFPIQPHTVNIVAGAVSFVDDGCGRLFSSAGGSGTVRYDTGAVSVTFAAAPANALAITADYMSEVTAVLDEAIDTAVSGSGLCIVHGSVQADVLKVKSGAVFVAVDVAMQKRLSVKGIYPA